ncbi:MAG: acyl carrier protein [Magnetospirillum sp.]|nr:acyl carrier protein [Magnetospirillum sp.]
MLITEDIRQVIITEIRKILDENGRRCGVIDDDALLTDDVGLDSLGLASLFIFLEDRFGTDPFMEKFNIVDMRTVADLVRAYRAVVAEPALV